MEKIKSETHDKIELRDPIFEEKDLITQYQQARVFVYPSKAQTGETFGLAVLEAMSCGCVPLVSLLECFSDFIKDGINGFQLKAELSEREDALFKGLQTLLNNPNLESLNKHAQNTAKEYEVRHVAGQFLQDFQTLINE